MLQERKYIEKKRVDYSAFVLGENGIDISFQSAKEIRFYYNGSLIKFFPFTGWFTGKTVKDGRGLQNLINQIT